MLQLYKGPQRRGLELPIKIMIWIELRKALSITTYQFVEVSQLESGEFVSHKYSIHATKNQYLIKTHFFESSTASSHINEPFYFISLDKYK